MSGRAQQDGIRVAIGAKVSKTKTSAQSRSSTLASSGAIGLPQQKKVGNDGNDGKGKRGKGSSRGKGAKGKMDKAPQQDVDEEEEHDPVRAAMNEWVEAAVGPRVVQPPKRDKADAGEPDKADALPNLDESVASESAEAETQAVDINEQVADAGNAKEKLEETVTLAGGQAIKSWVEWVSSGDEGNYVMQARIMCEKDGMMMKKAPVAVQRPYQFVYNFGGRGDTKLEAQCAAATKALDKARSLLPLLRAANPSETDEEVFFLSWCELVVIYCDGEEKSSISKCGAELTTPAIRDKKALVVAKSTIAKAKFQPAPKKLPVVEETPPKPPASPPPAALLGAARRTPPKLQPVAKVLPTKPETSKESTESFTKAASKAKADDYSAEASSGCGMDPTPQQGSDSPPVRKPVLPVPVQNSTAAIVNGIATVKVRPSLPFLKEESLSTDSTTHSGISGTSLASSSSTSAAIMSANAGAKASCPVQPKHRFAAYMPAKPRTEVESSQVSTQSSKLAESWGGSVSSVAEAKMPQVDKSPQEQPQPRKSYVRTPMIPTAPAWDSWGQEDGTSENSTAKATESLVTNPPGLKQNDNEQSLSESVLSSVAETDQKKTLMENQNGATERSSAGHQQDDNSIVQKDSKNQQPPFLGTSSAQLNAGKGFRENAWNGNRSLGQTQPWGDSSLRGQTPAASSFPSQLPNKVGANPSLSQAGIASPQVFGQVAANAFATSSTSQPFGLPASSPTSHANLMNGSVGREHVPASTASFAAPTFPPGLSINLPQGGAETAPSTSLGLDAASRPMPKLLDIPSGPSFRPPAMFPAKAPPPLRPPGPPPGLPPGLSQDFKPPAGTFADTSRPEDHVPRSRSRSAGRSRGGREEVVEERRLVPIGQMDSKRVLEDQGQRHGKTRRTEVLPGNWSLLKHTVEGMFRHSHGNMALFSISLELRVFEDEWVAIPVIGTEIIVAEWEVCRAADTAADNSGLPQWKPVQLGSDTLLDIKKKEKEDGQACEEHNLVTNISGWYKISFQAYIRVRKDGTSHSFLLNLLYPISATQLRLVHDATTCIKELSVEPAAFFEVEEGNGQSNVSIKLASTKSVEVQWHAQAKTAAAELPLLGAQAPGDNMQEMAKAMQQMLSSPNQLQAMAEMLKNLNGSQLHNAGGGGQTSSTRLPAVAPAVAAHNWAGNPQAWPRDEHGRQWHATPGQQTEDL